MLVVVARSLCRQTHPSFVSLHRAWYGELFTIPVVVGDWEHSELFVAVRLFVAARRQMAEQERTGLLMESALIPASEPCIFEQRSVRET
jgi:hypothetical protein